MKGKLLFGLFFVLLAFSTAFSQTLVDSVEAESGVLTGVNIAAAEGNSSGPYVTGFDSSGDRVAVTVTVPTTGLYNVVIRYRGRFGFKVNNLYVNNAFAGNISFPASTDFVDIAAGSAIFNAGTNVMEIRNNWGWFDLDKFSVYTKPANVYNITSTLVDPEIAPAAQQLYNFIKSVYGEKIMTGQTTDYYDTIVAVTGKRPVVRAFDLLTYSPMYPWKWGGTGHIFGPVENGEVERAITWYNATDKKGVVTFHWHWYSPFGGQAGTNTFYTNQTTFDVSRAVIPGTEENIAAIRDIDAIAVQLKRLRDAGVPVIWRPLHEAGGGWFWWGAKGPGPALALWDILQDRLMNYHDLHNLIWSWSTPEADWYPGHSKVDILGFDSYPGSRNYSIQKGIFDQLHNIGGGEKIVAMTENGPIPDLNQAMQFDARWSWFASWNNLVFEQNSREHIINMFNSPYALTIENSPGYILPPASVPVFSPPSGTYNEAQSVTITSTTEGATIYYTTDGSDPTTASSVYTSPITVTVNTTIKAFAIKSGLDGSAIDSASYVINVAAPVISPGDETFTTAQSVTITSATEGATIYYTTDGSVPDTTSTVYSGPITVSSTTTINAIATRAGMGNSLVTSATITIETLVIGGIYQISPRNSSKAISIIGGSIRNNAAAILESYNGGEDQQFQVVDGGAGTYKLVAVHSNRALEIAGLWPGAPVVQRNSSRSGSQKWEITGVASKYFKIVNKNSRLALRASTVSIGDVGFVYQYNYNGSEAMQWKFELISSPDARSSTSIASMFEEEIPSEDIISVFPNPAIDHVTIDLAYFENTTVNVDLANLDGRILRNEKVMGGGTYQLNVSNLQSGSYLIKLNGKGRTVAKKIIKK